MKFLEKNKIAERILLMLALVADSEKLDRVSSYSMRGKFFCPADDIQLKSHWKIGHRLALLTDKMIMKSRYSVIAFDAVSKISAFDAPFFDQYPHVAVNVSQADRWNFFSKNIVQPAVGCVLSLDMISKILSRCMLFLL